MKKTVALTIDVEPDCPPYLQTYKGIETGLPLLCSVLDRFEIDATFFVTGDVASKYPKAMKVISRRHEIGCHGYSHKRFDRMSYSEAVYEIEKSTDFLCHLFGKEKLDSFRAPNLKFPGKFLKILKVNGYSIDSSLAKYKFEGLRTKSSSSYGLLRIPVSVTSSMLRFPFGKEIMCRLPEPIVLFFHPWEFVEMQNENIRWDCKKNTGQKALLNLRSLIETFKNKNYRFCTMSGFLDS